MGRLDGKVVLISGGARGQGAVEARMMAQEGARVVIGDILDDLGRQVEAELAEAGLDVTYVHLDVTSEDDWNAAVAAAVSAYGHLDTLVNNAGILIRKGIEDTTVEDWDRIMDVTPRACFLAPRPPSPPCGRPAAGPSSTSRPPPVW